MSDPIPATAAQADRDSLPVYTLRSGRDALDGVPPGYKQTEIGTIPVDWDVCRLKDLARIVRGASPRPIADPKWFDNDSEIGWLRISDVAAEGKFVYNTSQNLSSLGVARSRLVEPDNLVMSMAATVGRPAITRKRICIHDGFVLFLRPVLPLEFFFYLLSSIEGQWSERGQTGSQVNLNTNLIGTAWVPVPRSSEEQRAIATALSDADVLIESLDRLIAKKRAIKQAAMQELLTGEIRLPGFEGQWGVRRLDEIGWTYGGLTGKTGQDFGRGSGRYVTFLNVVENTVVKPSEVEPVVMARGEKQNCVHAGDLLFNGSSETPDEVGLCALVDRNLGLTYLNSFCFGFRLNDAAPADGLYLAYYFRSQVGRELMKVLAQGSTRFNLSKKAFLATSIRVPEKREQEAIAAVLWDMDAEIEALVRRREKAWQIKQGMMQELLTGRTRLVEVNQEAVDEAPA